MPRRSRTSATSFSTDDATTTVTLPSSAVAPPSTFTDGLPLPKLIVFDLDYTLWPFWVDTHVTSPLKGSRDNGLSVRDAYGGTYGFYNDVAGLLSAIKQKNIRVGVASRTCAPDLARQMLTMLRVPLSSSDDTVMEGGGGGGSSAKNAPNAISVFDYVEMYPGSKTSHFQRIRKASGVPYEEMLFFDDESRNRNVEELGVVMQLVRDGVTRAEVDKGVESWRKRNERTKREDASGGSAVDEREREG